MFAKKTHINTNDPKPDGSFFSPKVQANLKTDNTDFMNSQVVHQSGNGGFVQAEKVRPRRRDDRPAGQRPTFQAEHHSWPARPS